MTSPRPEPASLLDSPKGTAQSVMANFATLLKTEIARIARKELRGETENLKKANSSYRSEIVALKRRVQQLEKDLRRIGTNGRRAPDPQMGRDSEPFLRFSAKGLAGHRKRLGLSARDMGALLGASGLSVYKWEKGESRPRTKFLPAIAMLRKMGRREAAARLHGQD